MTVKTPASLPHYLALLKQLTRREFEARYRGTLLGLAWALINPLVLMALYTFVFQSVLSARWPGHPANDSAAYALNLLAGLVVFNLLAESLGRAPRLLLENPSYIKKLVFPLSILPLVALLGSMLSALLGGTILLTFQWFAHGMLTPQTLLVPLLLIPLLLSCLGILYLFSALGVFLRDISQMTGSIVMMLMFLSPVFYPAENIPLPWRHWLSAHPLARGIEWTRGAIFAGTLPTFPEYLTQVAVGSLILAAGYKTFQALRTGFADVL